MIYVPLFSSFQDSMDEACAERIGDEHYRLEGRPPALHHHHHQRLHQLISLISGPLYFDLNDNLQKHCSQLPSRYLCVSFILSRLLHTHSLSPNNVLMRSPLPSLPPLRLLCLSSAPPPLWCSAKCLHSSMFFPRCDVILD